jgi:uncharacterized damage-inducible protein DinB
MDAVDALTRAINASHQWYQGTVADVTSEQANYLPSGTAHPIGELAAHIVQGEDGIINGMLLGEQTVWEQGGWEQKLGIPNMQRLDKESARSFKCEVSALKEYTDAVYASTEAYLSGLQPSDLDREIDGPGGKMTVADVIGMFLLGNTFAHTGEISALKGLQGAKGYPF